MTCAGVKAQRRATSWCSRFTASSPDGRLEAVANPRCGQRQTDAYTLWVSNPQVVLLWSSPANLIERFDVLRGTPQYLPIRSTVIHGRSWVSIVALRPTGGPKVQNDVHSCSWPR